MLGDVYQAEKKIRVPIFLSVTVKFLLPTSETRARGPFPSGDQFKKIWVTKRNFDSILRIFRARLECKLFAMLAQRH